MSVSIDAEVWFAGSAAVRVHDAPPSWEPKTMASPLVASFVMIQRLSAGSTVTRGSVPAAASFSLIAGANEGAAMAFATPAVAHAKATTPMAIHALPHS